MVQIDLFNGHGHAVSVEANWNVKLEISCDSYALCGSVHKGGNPGIGPLFPHYRYRADLLEDLFRALRDAGTSTIFAEHLNTSSYILRRIQPLLKDTSEEVRSVYQNARTNEHKKFVSEMVMNLVEKYGFTLRLGKVIDHSRDKSAH